MKSRIPEIQKIKEKRISRFKYPKFFILLLTVVLAYFIFAKRDLPFIHDIVLNSGYIGTFLAGIFFTYGFTSVPATAIFLILAKSQNILFAGLIGGVGALCGDLIIFHFIRFSFNDEIKQLKKERIMRWLHRKIPGKLQKYLLIIFADIIIASPLPDEIGVAMLAAYHKVSVKLFSIFSYILNTLGIFIILLIGKAVI